MGCGRNVQVDMLNMALFCTLINDVLADFCEGQSHANLWWIRVRGAINFLSFFPEQKRGGTGDFPQYGFSDDVRPRRLTYEQLVVTQNFLKHHKKRLLGTKKRLPMILDLKLSPEERREAARYCIELFSGLHGEFNYYFNRPPNFGIPKGLEKLLNPPKSKRKTKPVKA